MMPTYKVYPPNDNKRWTVTGERNKETLKAGSVLILKDCEAICERIDKYSWELIIETWQVMIDEAYSEVLTERKTR